MESKAFPSEVEARPGEGRGEAEGGPLGAVSVVTICSALEITLNGELTSGPLVGGDVAGGGLVVEGV